MMQRTEQLSEETRLTSMGLRLRQAREALQISESSAADQLFLTVAQVRALEEARYDQLPAEVFVRGYLRSYARLLGLDPEDILRQYSAHSGTKLSVLDGGGDDEPTAGAAQGSRLRVGGGRGTSAAPIAASATSAPSAWRERFEALFKPGTNKLEDISDTTLMALSGLAIVLVIGTVVALLFLGGGRASDSLVSAAAQDGDLAGQALVVDPELFEVLDDATQVKINLPSAGEDQSLDDAAAPARDAEAAEGNAAAQDSAALGGQMLELTFSADCWVEVKDASRNILLADMRRAGDREVFKGQPPYKVLLGRADAVTIHFGGRPFPVEVDDGKDYTRVVIGG